MALRGSEEKTNGAKLSRLLIDGGTSALQTKLDNFHPPANLAAALLSHEPLLSTLKKRKIVNQQQWDLLFPADASAPDSSKFDITLLFALLRNICGLTEPATGWNNLPLPGDNSLEANLARVKYYRNTLYGHVSTTGIDRVSFSHYWKEIETALVALGIDKSEIDRLRDAPLEEELYLKLMLDLETQEKNVQAKLIGIDATAEEHTRKMEEIQNSQAKIQVNLLQQYGKARNVGGTSFIPEPSSVIGKGGHGTKVYRGTYAPTPGGAIQPVAVKKMFKGTFDMKEAQILTTLKHQHIVKCFEVQEDDEFIYLTLELCNKTLKQCVRERIFEAEDFRRCLCLQQVTSAVEYLHKRRICHRDIKPDNILMSQPDAKRPAKFVLADFNCSRLCPNESFSTKRGIAGTDGWIAPEVYQPGKSRNLTVDMFSLGCLFHYTLTDGKHPFGELSDSVLCQDNICAYRRPNISIADFLELNDYDIILTILDMISFEPGGRPSASIVGEKLQESIAKCTNYCYSNGPNRKRLKLDNKGTEIALVTGKQSVEESPLNTSHIQQNMPGTSQAAGEPPRSGLQPSSRERWSMYAQVQKQQMLQGNQVTGNQTQLAHQGPGEQPQNNVHPIGAVPAALQQLTQFLKQPNSPTQRAQVMSILQQNTQLLMMQQQQQCQNPPSWQQGMQPNIQQGLQQSMQPGMQQNPQAGMQQALKQGLSQDMQSSLQPGLSQAALVTGKQSVEESLLNTSHMPGTSQAAGESPRSELQPSSQQMLQGNQATGMQLGQQGPGGQPQNHMRPSGAVPAALQQLLQALKSPKSPTQEAQIMSILKQNPQLAAAIIRSVRCSNNSNSSSNIKTLNHEGKSNCAN